MAKKHRSEIIEDIRYNPDEHALFYTVLGFMWWFLMVYILMWVVDGCSMFSTPEPMYYNDSEFCNKVESFCDEEEDSLFRNIPSPRPVIIPYFDDIDEVDTEEYQNKIRENPPKSTMDRYIII